HGEAKMEFIELFDGPNVCDCYRRTASVLPQQALAMSNSDLLLQQARGLAGKLWAETTQRTGDEAQRASEFWRAALEGVLIRPPIPDEVSLTRDFLVAQEALFRASSPEGARAAPAGPSRSPAQRARESLVHALFNHNDFVTIR